MATKKVMTYQLKIILRDIEPTIWRRFLVKSSVKLPVLHGIIQTVMGWTDSHLHHFIKKGTFYCIPDEFSDELPTRDYRKVKVSDLLAAKGDKVIYEYDFGDGWEHDLILEDILPLGEGRFYPKCLAGKRNCPPEDCGGSWGYEDILKALKAEDKTEYEDLLEWVGDYDPEYFDLDQTNEMLKIRSLVK